MRISRGILTLASLKTTIPREIPTLGSFKTTNPREIRTFGSLKTTNRFKATSLQKKMNRSKLPHSKRTIQKITELNTTFSMLRGSKLPYSKTIKKYIQKIAQLKTTFSMQRGSKQPYSVHLMHGSTLVYIYMCIWSC